VMAKLKGYSILLAAWSSWEVDHCGRHASQVQAIVRTTSKKRAAKLFGVSLHHFNTYGMEPGVKGEVALDAYSPDTVLIKGLDPGDTIGGDEGWVPRPTRPSIRGSAL
jgi:hypothetical protein